jgi:hypothetical protein
MVQASDGAPEKINHLLTFFLLVFSKIHTEIHSIQFNYIQEISKLPNSQISPPIAVDGEDKPPECGEDPLRELV